jgi:hypothetical protein
MDLYEIVVPTRFGDNGQPIRTAHHKSWDKRVQAISGGLTILSPVKGKWLFQGIEYPERVIPVRIACDSYQMAAIAQMTLQHYRQKSVMYYKLSSDVTFIYA